MYTIRGLINNELWFSDPKSFNDPYDCRLAYDTNNSLEEIKAHLNKLNIMYTNILKSIQDPLKQMSLIKELTGVKSDDEVYSILEGIFKETRLILTEKMLNQRFKEFENNKQGLDNLINRTAQEDLNNYRIFCLSKESRNNVMWAHYSNNHRGICIELDTRKDKNYFDFVVKVNYPGKYPKFNYIREFDNHNSFRFIIGTKYRSWNYEREYRIIKDKRTTPFRNLGLLKYDQSIINSIIFGINTSDDDIELIKKINKDYYNEGIKLFKAKEIQRSFKLEYKKI